MYFNEAAYFDPWNKISQPGKVSLGIRKKIFNKERNYVEPSISGACFGLPNSDQDKNYSKSGSTIGCGVGWHMIAIGISTSNCTKYFPLHILGNS